MAYNEPTGFTDNARPRPIKKTAVKKIRKVRKNGSTNVIMNRTYTSSKSSKYTAVTKLNGATVTVTHKTKHICESATADLLSAFGYTPKWTEGITTAN